MTVKWAKALKFPQPHHPGEGKATVTVLGTLGFQANALLPSVTSRAGVQELIAFSSPHPQGRIAVGEIATFCAGLGLPFRDIVLPDVYDLIAVGMTIRREIARVRGERREVAFNVTGGLRIAAAAAQLVCILEGVPTEYVRENGEVVPLPLMRLDFERTLSEPQIDILREILRHEGRSASYAQLLRTRQKGKGTLSYHLRQLQERGLVRIEELDGDGRQRRVVALASLDLLLQRKATMGRAGGPAGGRG